ncbi:MAG: kelch motif-containing protein [Kiritimatiellae bacterium]|nr:kelch motif-containing protein [Kiritimatiellia bacterium]
MIRSRTKVATHIAMGVLLARVPTTPALGQSDTPLANILKGLPENQWKLLPVRAPNIVWETGIAYDPETHWIVRHGGHILGSYAQDNYTDLFDLPNLRFARSRAPWRPQRRCLVDLAYVDSMRRVLTVNGGSAHGSLPQGGPNSSYTGIVQRDPRGPWLYTMPRTWPGDAEATKVHAWPAEGDGDTWEDCRTLGPQQWKRAAHSPICYDPITDTLFGISGNVLNLFSPRKNRVMHLPLPPEMGSRVGHSLGVDPAAGKLVLFGGSKDGGWVWVKSDRAEAYRRMVMNDTWVFDIAKRTWKQAKPGTNPPRGAPLVDHLPAPMVYHPPSGTILMLRQPLDEYEPDNTRWPPAELWSFDATAEEWSRVLLTSPHDQPAFPGHLVYATHEDVLVLWGGGRDGIEGDHVRGALSRELRIIRVRLPGRTPVDLSKMIQQPVEPVRPAGLRASVESERRVVLHWSANSQPDLAGYKVYRARGADIEKEQATCLTATPIQETRFVDDRVDLTDGVLRVYYVTALNRAGRESGPSPLAYTAPDAVTHLDAVMTRGGDGTRRVTLSWRWREDVKVSGFHIYHATRHINGTDTDEFRKLWTRRTDKPVETREYVYVVPAAEPDLQLFYVRAVNILGQEGFYSDIVSPTDPRFRP